MTFGACPASMDAARAQIPAERAAVLEFGCASVSVPLVHDNPSGERLSLAVARVRHRSPVDPVGSLVLLSGGPGQSGLELASTAATLLPMGLLQRFDVVTYDPRGVGESAPINCGTTPDDASVDVPIDMRTAAGVGTMTAANRRFSTVCAERLGARAGDFSTIAAVRDLDLLREALGERQLTAIGYSYGAKVAAQYAHRFPDKVRALVVDAPTDPRTAWPAALRPQVRGFEEAFDEYASGCTARPDCARLDGGPRAFAIDLIARLFAQPVASRRPQDTELANGYDVVDAILASMYDPVRWPDLDAGLYEARFGDAGTLFGLVESVQGPPVTDPSAPDPADAGFVINCTDAPPGPTDAEVMAAAATIVAESPLFGPAMTRQLTGCREWSAPRVVLELPTYSGALPVVVVGTVHDPATPYSGAVSMTEVLGKATLVTYEGQGHTAMGRSPCIDAYLTAYLANLTIPPNGARCPA